MAHLNPGVAVWLWVAVLAAFVTTAMSQKLFIPPIPAGMEDSPLANLWRHALSQQQMPDFMPAPKTFLAPSFFEVINWVPQDCVHPLYIPEYAPLLREILLDYMVQVEVKPDDPRMSEPGGLHVTNRNAKTLIFKRDASGMSVNGVPVVSAITIAYGNKVLFNLDESLFDHREKVYEAWKEVPKPTWGPFPGFMWK